MRQFTTAIFGAYLVLLRQTLAADSNPLLFARQTSGSCSSGSKLCGNGCIDSTWTCCPDKAGGCRPTESCVLGTNGQYGCCPEGQTCVGNGGAITSVAIPSGTLVSTADSGPISSHATNQPFTTGGSIGVVGTDGSTRFCSTGSYLCPASLDYGCCPNGNGCGLTNCPTLASTTGSYTATTTISSLSSVVAVTTASSATVGQVVTAGNSIGTVGTDGTTRFCTTGSYLCPASLSYGCCPNTDACGLTNCPHRSTTLASGAGTTSSSVTTTLAVVDGLTTSLGIGVPFTTGGSVGVLGTDATIRYCTTGSYLCPASFNYGCCPNTDACGLTDCPHTTQTGSTSSTSIANVGATITGSTAIGVVGTDGTTRFCTTGSSLCPASLNYGCCVDGYACGLTDCSPTGGSISYPTTTADTTDSNINTAFFITTGSVFTESAKPIVGGSSATTSSTSTVAPAKSSATVVDSSFPFAIGALFVLIATLAFGL